MQTAQTSIFRPGKNCWRAVKANHASLVVDCANYYRNLYESMMKAKHSIFVTGWDIDSRVELLRGDYVKDPEGPKNLYELLTMKAGENPDLQIYLNRWDYSLVMAETREPMGLFKWRGAMLSNIHFVKDDMVPFGACHHQKVIVIDDEIAYTGGMDIALLRWDRREHFPEEENRVDPGGTYNPQGHTAYGPYHDIMTMFDGQAARTMAELARERWKLATGFDPVPLREVKHGGVPPTWPESDGVDFENIDIAVARTIPPMEVKSKEYYIEEMYLAEIMKAERFIYMENQYFTRESIAEALNAQLRKKPNLKVVLVSSYNPQGVAEQKILWSGRVKFYEMLKKGGVANRVVMVYPASEVNGNRATVRIHSKFMIVDDKFMHVGSANINNRSMRVDTECDVIYAATTDAHRQKILDIRNDLIKEHTGREPEQTEEIIAKSNRVHDLVERVEGSRQFFHEVTDEDFVGMADIQSKLVTLATIIGDPQGDILPDITILPRRHADPRRFPLQKIIFSLLVVIFIAALAAVWRMTPLGEYINPDKLAEMFGNIQDNPAAGITAIAVYVGLSLVMVPTAALTAGVAMTFGPTYGFVISLAAAMTSAVIGFMLGRLVKPELLGMMMGSAIERVRQHTENSSIASITFLRILPIAPFSAVNIALGLVKVPVISFFVGTLLGFLPGTIILTFMGESLAMLWKHQDATSMALVGAGLALWIGIIVASQMVYRRWQNKHGKATA